MVYQVGGQNWLKGFLVNNWLDLDNTMNLYAKEHFILIVITMFLLLHTGHSEAVIAVSFSPDGR